MGQLSKPGDNTPAESFKAEQNGKPQPIAWHPAFIEAIQLELEDYGDFLEFHPEYQLTSEPLRVDCLVIKKPPDIVIKKNIAAIFRDVNLLEYKIRVILSRSPIFTKYMVMHAYMLLLRKFLSQP